MSTSGPLQIHPQLISQVIRDSRAQNYIVVKENVGDLRKAQNKTAILILSRASIKAKRNLLNHKEPEATNILLMWCVRSSIALSIFWLVPCS